MPELTKEYFASRALTSRRRAADASDPGTRALYERTADDFETLAEFAASNETPPAEPVREQR